MTSFNWQDTRVLICGMGRVGTGAYDHLHQSINGHVVGIDFDDDKDQTSQRCSTQDHSRVIQVALIFGSGLRQKIINWNWLCFACRIMKQT